jgi:MoxR-like ATPase
MAQFTYTDAGEWQGTGIVHTVRGTLTLRADGGMVHTSNGQATPHVENYVPGTLICTTQMCLNCSAGGQVDKRRCSYTCHNRKGAHKCTDACGARFVPSYAWQTAAWRQNDDRRAVDVAQGERFSFRLWRFSERACAAWPVVSGFGQGSVNPSHAGGAHATHTAQTAPDPRSDGWGTFVIIVNAIADVARAAQATAQAAPPAPAQVAAAMVKLSTLERLCRYLSAKRPDGTRINPLLVGPAGSGKTTLCKLAAERLGVPFRMIKLSDSSLAQDIVGEERPIGGGQPWEFKDTAFTTTIRDGGLVLIDELDCANPNAATALHDALANGHMVINGEIVARHEHGYVVATANTHGTGGDRVYQRNALDGATLSRFQTITVDYDAEYEAGVIAQCEDAAARDALTAFHTALRSCIVSHSLPRIWSTRHLIDWVALLNVGITVEDLAAEYFAAWDRNNLRTARDARVPHTPAVPTGVNLR